MRPRFTVVAAWCCLAVLLIPARAGLLDALTGGSGGGGGGPLTNVSGPACESLSPAIRGVLKTLPAPRADDLCGTLLNSPFATPCELGSIIEWGLSRTTSQPPKCRPQEAGEVALSPLADLRPLPPGSFANASEVAEEEGATYFWLYHIVQRLEGYLGCFLEGGAAWTPPQGWRLVSMLNLTQQAAAAPSKGNESSSESSGGGMVDLPFAAVLLNPETEQLVVALRGTMTNAEWLLDFAYNQTDADSATFGSPVHDGFASAFRQLWPGIQAALSELVAQGPSPQAREVYVAGHSLGGGLGTLVAFAAQAFLDEQMGAAAAPLISAALFAPPNVGPPQFVEAFNAQVNSRRLAFIYDIVPQAFCTPEMPACAPGRQPGVMGGLLDAAGIRPIPTNQPGDAKSWPYATVGGTLPIAPEQMPLDAKAWRTLDRIQLCWAVPYLFASHVCSYACWASQFVGDGSGGNSSATYGTQCWLSPQAADAPGSTCEFWPTDYPAAAA